VLGFYRNSNNYIHPLSDLDLYLVARVDNNINYISSIL
jgi:hypothetical protein